MLVVRRSARRRRPARRRRRAARRPRRRRAAARAAARARHRGPRLRAFDGRGGRQPLAERGDRGRGRRRRARRRGDRAAQPRPARPGASPAPTPTCTSSPPERAVAVRIGYGERRGDRRRRLHRGARGRRLGQPAPRGAGGARRTCARRNGSRRCSAAASAADACETLLLRARADLDAGREREAALQLRVGLEALLVELRGALADPGHAARHRRRSAHAAREVGEAANAALRGDLTPGAGQAVASCCELAERILRRRRLLSG